MSNASDSRIPKDIAKVELTEEWQLTYWTQQLASVSRICARQCSRSATPASRSGATLNRGGSHGWAAGGHDWPVPAWPNWLAWP